ncbi:MAG: DUF502 domain-containing protein [Bacillota bacterium]|nr:MAG: DUF502 domain-containing protein [Bacillota bacterium]
METVRRIRNYLVTGLIVLLPVVVTWQVLRWLFNLVDGLLRGVVARVFGHPVPGVGLAVTILVVFLVGVLAANYVGRRLLDHGEAVMRRTPIVRSVYVTIKQITDAFVRRDQAAFKRVCMFEYPRKGIYTLAFVTSSAPVELKERARQDLVGVFVPTTPNPTSGFLLYVPRSDIVILDMSVEAGLRLVISGGIVPPDETRRGP